MTCYNSFVFGSNADSFGTLLIQSSFGRGFSGFGFTCFAQIEIDIIA